MSRGDKKRSYEHARRLVKSGDLDDHESIQRMAHGTFHDFRVGMALCALLGISTCVGKERSRFVEACKAKPWLLRRVNYH